MNLSWEIVCWSLKKLEHKFPVPHTKKRFNIEFPYDPTTPLLEIYQKELRARSQIDTCTSMFIAPLFTTAKK
jgi:hypothetical protein